MCQMAKAGTLLSCLNQREIRLGEPVSFKLSHFEEQQKKKTNKKTDPSSDKESDESFPDDETACDDSHSIFGMRDSLYPQKIFPTSEEVFASTEELCLFPCYGSNGSNGIVVTFFVYVLVDIVICFFETDLSLLICLSVIKVKRKEVVTMTSVRYSCKTLKTSK